LEQFISNKVRPWR